MAAPFLEIITRCYKRPEMLQRNIASLKTQTNGDFIQTFLVDNEGRGVGWAQENMANYAPQFTGRYIWILDDDDMCTRDTLVSELMAIDHVHDPDLIMVRMDHGSRSILPDNRHWEQSPEHGFIGCSAYIVKREVWQAHAAAWFPGTYYSDFNFIKSIFDSEPRIFWHDVIASKVQKISLGTPE